MRSQRSYCRVSANASHRRPDFRERLSGNPAGRIPLLSPHPAHTNRRTLFATSSNPKIPGNIHQLDPLLRSRTATKIARTPTMALSADQRSSSRLVMMPPLNSRIVIYYSPFFHTL